jgi:hypothetical protein
MLSYTFSELPGHANFFEKKARDRNNIERRRGQAARRNRFKKIDDRLSATAKLEEHKTNPRKFKTPGPLMRALN